MLDATEHHGHSMTRFAISNSHQTKIIRGQIWSPTYSFSLSHPPAEPLIEFWRTNNASSKTIVVLWAKVIDNRFGLHWTLTIRPCPAFLGHQAASVPLPLPQRLPAASHKNRPRRSVLLYLLHPPTQVTMITQVLLLLTMPIHPHWRRHLQIWVFPPL